MGLNTTVLILNDALGDIAKDPDFGKKLVAAIADGGKQVVISTPSFGNAATVIESHHSDNTVLIAVGGNCASVLYNKIGGKLHTKEARWDLLEEALENSTRPNSV
jgi:hypothetical protein